MIILDIILDVILEVILGNHFGGHFEVSLEDHFCPMSGHFLGPRWTISSVKKDYDLNLMFELKFQYFAIYSVH